jgi:hypothetical protein
LLAVVAVHGRIVAAAAVLVGIDVLCLVKHRVVVLLPNHCFTLNLVLIQWLSVLVVRRGLQTRNSAIVQAMTVHSDTWLLSVAGTTLQQAK